MTLRIDMSKSVSTSTPVSLSGGILSDLRIDRFGGLQRHLLYSRDSFHKRKEKFASRRGRSHFF